MHALVTNDDGVESAGIRALAGAGVDAGLDVVVAAPTWDSSGASASLTAVEDDGRFLVDRRGFDELPDVPVFAVEAAPDGIVRLSFAARLGVCGDGHNVIALECAGGKCGWGRGGRTITVDRGFDRDEVEYEVSLPGEGAGTPHGTTS